MTGRERRKFPRAVEPLEAHVRIEGDLAATWTPVTVVNLSAGGVRFRVAQAMNPGSRLRMKIRLPGVPQLLELCGGVVWNQMQASEVVEHGVEFSDLTPRQQAQIDQLVSFLGTRP